MNEKKEIKTVGLGFFEALTLLSMPLVLHDRTKLTGVITWSWLWVLSPLWLTFIVAVFIAVVIVFVLKH